MARNPIIPPSPSDEAYAVDADQGEVFTFDDPFSLFEDWFALARRAEPNDPNAMALSTVGADGAPDVRIVLLKDVSEGGFTFYTGRFSAKGRQLAENAKAALCFHWKTIRRQVRLRGAVEEVAQAEADAYFASRARGARIGAWASKQSQPLESPEALKAAVAAEETRFDGEDVPRPDHWTGYRLTPSVFEFWVNRPYRLHDRLMMTREGDGWRQGRLYP